MTGLLDRLDERAAAATASWDPLSVFGAVCVGVGAPVAIVFGGAFVALFFWGDLLSVEDFL